LSCFVSNGWVVGFPNVPGEVTHNCENGCAHVASGAFPDCLPMNTALLGFAVSSFYVGSLFGGLFWGAIQTKLDRKKTIIFNNVGWIIGAILIAVSVSPAMFIIDRVFYRISCGLGYPSTYVGEISTIKSRGTMGTCNQLAIVIGIFLASHIGLPLAKIPLWCHRRYPSYCPILFNGHLRRVTQLPYFYNHTEEARENFPRLRPNSNISQEFYKMVEGQLGTAAARAIDGTSPRIDHSSNKTEKDSFEDTQVEKGIIVEDEASNEPMNMMQIFTDPLIGRISMTVIALHSIQQLIGMNAVMYYSTSIFNMSFDANMSMYMAIVTTAVNFAATNLSLILIDRMGRRSLLLTAEVSACIFSVLLIIGYVYSVGALLIVSVFGYVLSFDIIVGPISWMMTSEFIPTRASSSVGAVATATNWAMNFLISQTLPDHFC
jgi:MFS family permease